VLVAVSLDLPIESRKLAGSQVLTALTSSLYVMVLTISLGFSGLRAIRQDQGLFCSWLAIWKSDLHQVHIRLIGEW
jgi:hypothetical protein